MYYIAIPHKVLCFLLKQEKNSKAKYFEGIVEEEAFYTHKHRVVKCHLEKPVRTPLQHKTHCAGGLGSLPVIGPDTIPVKTKFHSMKKTCLNIFLPINGEVQL